MAHIKDKMTTHHLYILFEASFTTSITVDLRKVEPDGLTHSLSVRFIEAKDNVQLSDSTFSSYLPVDSDGSSRHVS